MSRVLPVVVGIVAVSVGCKGKSDQSEPTPARPLPAPVVDEPATRDPAPAGPAFAGPVTTTFAIYHLPKAKKDPDAALARLVRRSYDYLTVADGGDARTLPSVTVAHPPIGEFAPPDEQSLQYFGVGLSDAEKTGVQRSEQVTILSFACAAEDRYRVGRDALALASALAGETGGLLGDENTRQLFAAASWQARADTWTKEVPLAPAQFAVHIYRNGQLLRLVTLGLDKLGLPDLVANDVSPNEADSMNGLINLVAQTLAEGGAVGPDGKLAVDTHAVQGSWELIAEGTGKATITLAVATKEEGDAANRLWEIVFPGPPGSGAQERQSQLIDQLFGSKDEIIYAEHDDTLVAASRRAKEELMALRPKFANGIPDQERLQVKAPFTTDRGGTEWMWVDVLEWKGDQIVGLLSNDPYEVSRLKAGARVEVDARSVFDYLYTRADGTQAGNETSKILQKQMERR